MREEVKGNWSEIEIRNVSKYFARVVANKDVNFTIRKGEVLALLGENGAGKSTIMKILYGLYQADEGSILFDGKEERIANPKDAMKFGIGMIQQHFSLVYAHTVTENVILGAMRGVIPYAKAKEQVECLASRYGFDVDADALVGDLDVGVQQKVEIIKALFKQTTLLIMDEPTAVLTPQEADQLMEFVRQFVADGHAVVFITHKMKEVMEVADRIIVMRDGRISGDLRKEDTNEAELSRLMIGRDIVAPEKVDFEGSDHERSGLVVKNLSLAQGKVKLLDDISFHLRPGEVLGIAGVSGNGQEELCETICGIRAFDSGSVVLDGVDLSELSLRERIEQGIGYVPVDRHRDAMIGSMSLAENIYLKFSTDGDWNRRGLIDTNNLRQKTLESIEDFDIRAPGPDAPAGNLSGGNQQKLILSREMRLAKKLLILNQPTRGLDLGAINNIHSTVLKARAEGLPVLLISTELSEIFALSDRIAVMYKGRFMGIFSPRELNTEHIGLLMAGIVPDDMSHVAGEENRAEVV